jgi:hypothetical protein
MDSGTMRCKMLLGGFCVICGYDRCPNSWALQLHHMDPRKKITDLSTVHNGMTDQEVMRLLTKETVILVCSNCHAEIHCGMHPDLLIRRPARRRTAPLVRLTPKVTRQQVTHRLPDLEECHVDTLRRLRRQTKWTKIQRAAIELEFLSRKQSGL